MAVCNVLDDKVFGGNNICSLNDKIVANCENNVRCLWKFPIREYSKTSDSGPSEKRTTSE